MGTGNSVGEAGGMLPSKPEVLVINALLWTCGMGRIVGASWNSISPSSVGDGRSVGTGSSVGEAGGALLLCKPVVIREPEPLIGTWGGGLKIVGASTVSISSMTSVGDEGRSPGGRVLPFKVDAVPTVRSTVGTLVSSSKSWSPMLVGEINSVGIGISVGEVTNAAEEYTAESGTAVGACSTGTSGTIPVAVGCCVTVGKGTVGSSPISVGEGTQVGTMFGEVGSVLLSRGGALENGKFEVNGMTSSISAASACMAASSSRISISSKLGASDVGRASVGTGRSSLGDSVTSALSDRCEAG